MKRARPTLRCLREDLRLPLPHIDRPLDEIDHPLLAKTSDQFADPATPHERIRAIDDAVLFKVKIQRWRGAVWVEPELAWLVAAGRRESGSGDDFYAVLASDGRNARARHNAGHKPALTTDTYTAHLLPAIEDRDRYALEATARLVRRLQAITSDLVRASLCDGREHFAQLDTFALGVQVRADDGHETYVAISVTGSVPGNLVATILELIPGCDPECWLFEFTLPERLLRPGEQAWSNIMDPAAAAKLLDR